MTRRRDAIPDARNAPDPSDPMDASRSREGTTENPADDLLSALARPVDAPDLTPAIMGRLGYMRATPAAARRARHRRLGHRALGVVLTIVAAAVAVRVHETGTAPLHRLDGPTVPGAIGHDVRQHQERFQRTIRSIRNLAPGPVRRGTAPGPVAPEIDDDVNRSAVGPVRWL